MIAASSSADYHPQMSLVREKIQPLVDSGTADYGAAVTFVGGDWNFLAKGESRVMLHKPKDNKTLHNDYVFFPNLWSDILRESIELQQWGLTHFDQSTMSTSRIDRLYISTPAWALANVNALGSTSTSPHNLYGEGVSDHAPVLYGLHPPKVRHHGIQPIGREIFESKWFTEFHDDLVT